jgi:NMD protein affecting ribosome stability and mRNA decay
MGNHKIGCMCQKCIQEETNIENALEREETGKRCWNCGKVITPENRTKHYPINATMFCKE